jgi:hypothetical protein
VPFHLLCGNPIRYALLLSHFLDTVTLLHLKELHKWPKYIGINKIKTFKNHILQWDLSSCSRLIAVEIHTSLRWSVPLNSEGQITYWPLKSGMFGSLFQEESILCRFKEKNYFLHRKERSSLQLHACLKIFFNMFIQQIFIGPQLHALNIEI